MKTYPGDNESRWEPTNDDDAITERLLSSDDEIERLYGEARLARCFVREFHGPAEDDNIVAVGEMDALVMIEKRLNIHLDPQDLSFDDCVAFGAFMGCGDTLADRIRDGLRQIEEYRNKKTPR